MHTSNATNFMTADDVRGTKYRRVEFKCPATGHWVWTGKLSVGNPGQSITMSGRLTVCHACGEMHEWPAHGRIRLSGETIDG